MYRRERRAASSLLNAARDLTEVLNAGADSGPDWYWSALDKAEVEHYFDEAATERADPSYSSDVYVLSDGADSMKVQYDPRSGEWEAERYKQSLRAGRDVCSDCRSKAAGRFPQVSTYVAQYNEALAEAYAEELPFQNVRVRSALVPGALIVEMPREDVHVTVQWRALFGENTFEAVVRSNAGTETIRESTPREMFEAVKRELRRRR